MNQDIIKKLPFSMLAEQALLGSILIDPPALTQISDTVRAEDFHLSEHRQIYTAMKQLSLLNHDIDHITLLDELEKEKVYNRDEAEIYLRTLADAVPNALNIKDYARIVLEKSLMRRLIETCSKISERAYSEQENVGELIEYAAAQMSEIAMGRDSRGFVTMTSMLEVIFRNLSILYDDPTAFDGIQTGYSDLDNTLAGIGQSDLVLVGARPGMGKTSFCLNIALNYARRTKEKVAIFSLEMSSEQLVTRMLSSYAMVDSYNMRTGRLSTQDWQKLANSVVDLAGVNVLIDDTPNITVSGMKAKLRREGKIGLVVIDYLQLMQGDKHTDNRVQEVADISRNLKLMAKELHVPIICCSQLSRGTEGRTSKRPMLSDLRESGSIEQDADTVIFIYRDEYYMDASDKKNIDITKAPVAEIIVAKNRHGSTGTVKLNWIGRYTTFYSIEEKHGDDAPPDYGAPPPMAPPPGM
ncbi:MAG: replicative DNA helicase [Clostridia bacterium]|nr:replicative DNA helicase [Clostridia bacterium]